MLNLYSNPEYSDKYNDFLDTPPFKTGMCFGASITWLLKCVEAEINNKNTEKYLKLYVSDDFFWRAFSIQRHSGTLKSPTLFGGSAKYELKLHNAKCNLLKRIDDETKKIRQDNPGCMLKFSFIDVEKSDGTIEAFFSNAIRHTLLGMTIGLVNSKRSGLHAIALLKINENKYLYDPNFGVFNINNYQNISIVLTQLARFYQSPGVYRPDPRDEIFTIAAGTIN